MESLLKIKNVGVLVRSDPWFTNTTTIRHIPPSSGTFLHRV
jgi:hypothetical protein